MSGAPIPATGFKAKGATPERPGVSNEWFNTIYQVLLGRAARAPLRLLRRALRGRGDQRS